MKKSLLVVFGIVSVFLLTSCTSMDGCGSCYNNTTSCCTSVPVCKTCSYTYVQPTCSTCW